MLAHLKGHKVMDTFCTSTSLPTRIYRHSRECYRKSPERRLKNVKKACNRDVIRFATKERILPVIRQIFTMHNLVFFMPFSSTNCLFDIGKNTLKSYRMGFKDIKMPSSFVYVRLPPSSPSQWKKTTKRVLFLSTLP